MEKSGGYCCKECELCVPPAVDYFYLHDDNVASISIRSHAAMYLLFKKGLYIRCQISTSRPTKGVLFFLDEVWLRVGRSVTSRNSNSNRKH